MHLSFDKTPAKQGDNSVQDDSGNKNDAGLTNGAEISNRTMGKTYTRPWPNHMTWLEPVEGIISV